MWGLCLLSVQQSRKRNLESESVTRLGALAVSEMSTRSSSSGRRGHERTEWLSGEDEAKVGEMNREADGSRKLNVGAWSRSSWRSKAAISCNCNHLSAGVPAAVRTCRSADGSWRPFAV